MFCYTLCLFLHPPPAKNICIVVAFVKHITHKERYRCASNRTISNSRHPTFSSLCHAFCRVAAGKDLSLFGHQGTAAAREITVTVTATQTASTLSQSAVLLSRACPRGMLRSAPPPWQQHTAVGTTLTRGLYVGALASIILSGVTQCHIKGFLVHVPNLNLL